LSKINNKKKKIRTKKRQAYDWNAKRNK